MIKIYEKLENWKCQSQKKIVSSTVSSLEELWKLRLQVIQYSVIILIRHRVWESTTSEDVSTLINKWKTIEN